MLSLAARAPSRCYSNAVCRSSDLFAALLSTLRMAWRFLPQHGPLYQLAMLNGRTPLLAAVSGQLDVATVLLEARADPFVRHPLCSDAGEFAPWDFHIALEMVPARCKSVSQSHHR